MSKANHTRAPWHHHATLHDGKPCPCRAIFGEDGTVIGMWYAHASGSIDGVGPVPDIEEGQGNAALIAAAPDLLAACEDAIDRVPPHQRAMLRAAIAKAKPHTQLTSQPTGSRGESVDKLSAPVGGMRQDNART